MYGIKKVTTRETVGGPGIFVSEFPTTNQGWIGNEQVELEKIQTSLSLDNTYVETLVQNKVDIMLNTQLNDRLIKLIHDRVKLDFIVWDDKGTLTTRILVDGVSVLEKSVEIPMMDIHTEIDRAITEVEKEAI